MRLPFAMLVAGLLALGTPAAHAAADSTYSGTCGFDAVADRTHPGAWNGVVYDHTLVVSTTQADNPVSATVTCTLSVEGVPAGSASFSGTGAVAGAAPVSFVEGPYDFLELCTTVDFTSDATPTQTTCETIPPPDPFLCGLAGDGRDYPICWQIGDLLDEVWSVVDPALCPVLGGDVVVGGQWLYDCPPYGT